MASLYTPAEIAEVQRVAAEAAVAEAKDSTLKEGQEAAFRVGSTVQQVPVFDQLSVACSVNQVLHRVN